MSHRQSLSALLKTCLVLWFKINSCQFSSHFFYQTTSLVTRLILCYTCVIYCYQNKTSVVKNHVSTFILDSSGTNERRLWVRPSGCTFTMGLWGQFLTPIDPRICACQLTGETKPYVADSTWGLNNFSSLLFFPMSSTPRGTWLDCNQWVNITLRVPPQAPYNQG